MSSTAVKPGPGGDGGSSSDPKPPSKNEPEKSSVWALTARPLWVLVRPNRGFDLEGKGLRLWVKDIMGWGDVNWENDLGQNGNLEDDEEEEEGREVRVADSEEGEAIVGATVWQKFFAFFSN